MTVTDAHAGTVPTEQIPVPADTGPAAASGRRYQPGAKYVALAEPPTIYELLPRVMGDVGAVEKTRTQGGDGLKYPYRRVDDVMGALHGPLARHGVSMTITVQDRHDDERTSRGGAAQYVVRLLVEFRFYGPRGDSLASLVWGEGVDSGDKASAKAHSMALKYALLQTFCIPTQEGMVDADDSTPEESQPRQRRSGRADRAVSPEPQPAPASSLRDGLLATKAQKAKIHVLLEQLDISDDEYRAKLKEVYGVESSTQLSQTAASQLIKRLELSVREAQKEAGQGGAQVPPPPPPPPEGVDPDTGEIVE